MHQEQDYRLYMVYRIKVLLENGDPYEFYNYWCFKDIAILPDGTCTCNLDDYEICEDSVSIANATPKATRNGYSNFANLGNYRGCKTLDAIFNKEIAKYTDLYDYESTVKDGVPQSLTGNADVSPINEEAQDTSAAADSGSTQASTENATP